MIKGLIAPILTPFDKQLKLDQKMYNDLAKDLLNNGCSGLAPFGTTGEALSVGNDERMDALEGLIKSGIDPDILIPGTGLCNLPDTIKLTKHAIDMGCHGVMTLPPFYFKGMTDDGLFEHFEKLIEGVNTNKLKIYLYHIPQVCGVGLSIDLVQKLKSSFPETIVGIKDSSGVWENTEALLKIKDLIVYPGAELPVIEAIKLGAPGCISATANLNSKDIASVIELCHSKNWDEAEKLQKKVKSVRLLFQDYAPIPAQKALLAIQTKNPMWNNLRPPFQQISKEKSAELANTLRNEFGFAF
ncbi:dihydrodipicolinate synthase family protein [Alphaproteobacteria bacterium]|nr:dihydrodipicolinate synthase family protein [Alphaproteobacteria bacterium]